MGQLHIRDFTGFEVFFILFELGFVSKQSSAWKEYLDDLDKNCTAKITPSACMARIFWGD